MVALKINRLGIVFTCLIAVGDMVEGDEMTECRDLQHFLNMRFLLPQYGLQQRDGEDSGDWKAALL